MRQRGARRGPKARALRPALLLVAGAACCGAAAVVAKGPLLLPCSTKVVLLLGVLLPQAGPPLWLGWLVGPKSLAGAEARRGPAARRAVGARRPLLKPALGIAAAAVAAAALAMLMWH